MSTPEKKIDSVYDFTDKGLVELKAWLEPWFFDRGGGAVEWEDVGVDCSGSIYGSYEEVLRLTGGLVGYWKLDDALDFGGTFTAAATFMDNYDQEAQSDVVADSSGVGNHLDYVRDLSSHGPDVTLATGYPDLPGGASPQSYEWIASSGSAAAAMRAGALAGVVTPIKSVSFWFKTPTAGTPGGPMVGTHEVVSGGGGFGINKGWIATLGFSSFPGAGPASSLGKIEVWYAAGDTSIGSPPHFVEIALEGPFVTTDAWYHVAITSDGTTNTLYVNGLEVDTYTTVGNILATLPDNLKFGLMGYKSGFQWLGYYATGVTLDEVAMWTETVSEYHAGLQAHG